MEHPDFERMQNWLRDEAWVAGNPKPRQLDEVLVKAGTTFHSACEALLEDDPAEPPPADAVRRALLAMVALQTAQMAFLAEDLRLRVAGRTDHSRPRSSRE